LDGRLQSSAIITRDSCLRGQSEALKGPIASNGDGFVFYDRTVSRLWKAWQKKRILYLADRDVLVDRTMANDFRQGPGGWNRTKPWRNVHD
jgi:type I restriction enzyme R subunit